METTESKFDQVIPQGKGRRAFHRKVFYLLCLVLAFCIPIHPKIIPPVAALMVLNWLIEGNYIRVFHQLLRDELRFRTLAFGFIYILYLAGMLYSSNTAYGWFDLEVKLSLLLFPLIFATSDTGSFTASGFRYILIAFVAGCFTLSVILILYSFVHYYLNGVPEAFYYRNLSWYFHPSYIAMYFTFGIAILIRSLISDRRLTWRWDILRFALVSWFFFFIILLSSKAGILVTALVIAGGLVFLFLKSRSLIKTLIWLLIAVAAFALSLTLTTVATKRMTTAQETIGKPISGEERSSTMERMGIWKSGLIVLKSHWMFGVGTGDVKDALMETYRKEHYEAAYSQKLNAHNQYLQTFMALGIPGIITLLGMLLVPFIRSFRQEDFIRFSFVVIFALNIAVESMLETQAGVVFYAFFNCVLLWSVPFRKPGGLKTFTFFAK